MPALAAGVALAVILTAYVAYANVFLAKSWSEAIPSWVKSVLNVVVSNAPYNLAKDIDLARWIANKLGERARVAMVRAVAWMTGLAQYVAVVGYWSLLWPRELYNAVSWLVTHEIPGLIKAIPAPIVKVVHGVVKIVRRIETRIVHVTKTVYVTAKAAAATTIPWKLRAYLRSLEWLRTHWKALTAAVAGAGAIALPWGGAGRLERRVGSLAKRLGKLERAAAGLGAAGLVVAALSRLKLGWLRCSNVGKVGRRVCGLDGNLLGSLLLDTVAILSVLSVVEFARDLQAVEDEAVKILSLGIREFPSV